MGRVSLLLLLLSILVPFFLHALITGASACAASISIRQDPSLEACALACYPRAKFGAGSYEHQICDDPATIAGITACINDNCVGDALVAANDLLRTRCTSVGITLSSATPSPTSTPSTDPSTPPSAPPETSMPSTSLPPGTTSAMIAIVSTFGGIAVLTLLVLVVVIYRSHKQRQSPSTRDAMRSGDSNAGTGTVTSLGTGIGTGTGTDTGTGTVAGRGDRGYSIAEPEQAHTRAASPGRSHSAHTRGGGGMNDLRPEDEGYHEVLVRRVSDGGHPEMYQHPHRHNLYQPESARPSIQEALMRELHVGAEPSTSRRPPVYEQSI